MASTEKTGDVVATTQKGQDASANKSPETIWTAQAVRAGLQAVGLVILAAICSPISQLTLSPVYGSIPPTIHHPRLMLGAVLLAWISNHAARKHLSKDIVNYLPVLAYSIPTLQFFLFPISGRLGPVVGPIVTEIFTYAPLIYLSALSAARLFDSIDLRQYGEHAQDTMPGIVSYVVFKAAERAAKLLIDRGVGSGLLYSRSGLQFAIATCYSLIHPSKVLLLATIPVLHSAYLNVHVPLQTTTDVLNSTLHVHNYSLVARQEALTGYISILDSLTHQFRVMRCDHSLLGGEWLTTSKGHQRTVKEPVYAIFAMLEAVRLIESATTTAVPDDQAKALVIGLGIGTTPTALITHGIQTTIVEIDPVVHEFATRYFGLPENHTSIIEDAVTFLDRAQSAAGEDYSYDYIIHDVFTGGAEPVDLFTQEFIQGLSNVLKADGVVAINYAGDLLMPSASSVVRTVQSVFPACRLFREDAKPAGFSRLDIDTPTQDFTNMVMFCRKSAEPFTFRSAVEGDFLGSQSRRYRLVPQHEVEPGEFEGGKDAGEARILKRGQTQVLEKSQKQSAVGHWWLMRTVLPHAVWENW